MEPKASQKIGWWRLCNTSDRFQFWIL